MNMILHLCICNIYCFIEMSWDCFVHNCHGPFSFVIFNFGVYCLHFQFLFAYDGTSRLYYLCYIVGNLLLVCFPVYLLC